MPHFKSNAEEDNPLNNLANMKTKQARRVIMDSKMKENVKDIRSNREKILEIEQQIEIF